jgi:hypothetical protein
LQHNDLMRKTNLLALEHNKIYSKFWFRDG